MIDGPWKLPKGWEWTTIDNICDVKGRIGWRGYKKSDLRNEGAFVIGVQHLTEDLRIDKKNPKFISEEKYMESPEIIVSPGDIIVAQRGSIGKFAFVDSDIGKATINPCVLMLKNIKILPKFLLYLLASPRYKQQILEGESSTTTPMITQKFIKNLLIPIPPLSEQYRIITKIEKLFNNIRSARKALEANPNLMQAFKNTIVSRAFHGELVDQNLEDEPASSIDGVKIASGEGLYQIPRGWVWARISDLCQEIEKVNPRKNPHEEYLYVDVSSISNKRFIIECPTKSSGEDLPTRARQIIGPGDILFATVRPYLLNVAIVKKPEDGNIASTAFAVLRPIEGIRADYIFRWLISNEFLSRLLPLQRGISYPAVKNSDVLSQLIPIAPTKEQEKIIDRIEMAFSLITEMEDNANVIVPRLGLSESSILNLAFSGKLVSQDSKDEPAFILLGRIRKERKLNNRLWENPFEPIRAQN